MLISEYVSRHVQLQAQQLGGVLWFVRKGVETTKRNGKRSPKAIRVSAPGEPAVSLGMRNWFTELTATERKLVLLIAEGRTLVQVSQELGKYDEWASHTLNRLMQKLGATSHIELALKLVALGLIQVETEW